MTKLLEAAVITAQSLPPEMQDEIARMVVSYAGDRAVVWLTEEEEADLAASEAEALRGELASDEQVRAIWAKHGL